MPIIKSAIKRAKQTIKRRERNVGIKRDIKDATKAFIANPTAATLSAAHSELDTAVKKKLMKKNTVARRKAALAKLAKDAGVKLTSSAKAAPKTAVKAVAAKAPAATTVAAKPAVAKKAPAKTAVKKPVAKPVAAKKPVAKKTTK